MLLTHQIKRAWICCVSVGLLRLAQVALILFLCLLNVALLAWARTTTQSGMVVRFALLFVYGCSAVGITAAIIQAVRQWFWVSRTKRANSGPTEEALISEV
jgi:hypothetical protein